MAAKNKSLTLKDGPRRNDFSDFALVLNNGQELKCHKIKLAEVSQFFCSMLKRDCIETKSNKMEVPECDPETVESFLDYIYADYERVPEQDFYKRNFDKKRKTPDLLRMCHMYEVITDLLEECTEYLMININDNNTVDIWSVAETIGNVGLKKLALDHLGSKGDQLLAVPRLKESFQSLQLVESLVSYLSHQSPTPSSKDVITVKVRCYTPYEQPHRYEQAVQVKLSDTVKTLRLLVTDSLFDVSGSRWRCRPGSCRKRGCNRFEEEHRTLRFYNITTETVLECDIF